MLKRPIALAACCALALLLAAQGQDSSRQVESARLMTQAAQNFLASLSGEQKSSCLFPFSQQEWEKWHYIPMRSRVGIRYNQMTPGQVRMIDTLIAAGLSRSGYFKAKTVMSLEQLVYEMELAEGRRQALLQLRSPDYYYFAFYGDPSKDEVWGWRVEGHHISFHFTMARGEVRATTPMFLGAEPHLVVDGPRKGLRVLAAEEDRARALLAALDSTQRVKAIIADSPPRDIFSGNSRAVEFTTLPPKGVKRSEMNPEQQKLLQALIDEYIHNVPPDLAGQRIRRVQESGDEVYFAWMGSTEKGLGNRYYYRVHGKAFLIEFDNTQNNGNHSHSVWRDYQGDFGRDWLAEHYRSDH